MMYSGYADMSEILPQEQCGHTIQREYERSSPLERSERELLDMVDLDFLSKFTKNVDCPSNVEYIECSSQIDQKCFMNGGRSFGECSITPVRLPG